MKRILVDTPVPCPGRLRITGPEAHHAKNVIRLKTGDAVVLADTRGHEYAARIRAMDRQGLELEVIEKREALKEPELNLELGLALLKSDHMDLVVQKATELGLKTLTPLVTARTEVRLTPERAAKRLERWRRISGESLKQCRRAFPVNIRPLTGFPDFLAQAPPADLRLMLHESASGNPGAGWRDLLNRRNGPRSVLLLVGPEGGFSPDEAEQAKTAGFMPLVLGPRILRSETAAIAALAILGFEWGDLANFS